MKVGYKSRARANALLSRTLLVFSFFSMCAFFPAAAHVGSPDVFYKGDAGPYHLTVIVRVPQAIPGVAEVEVLDPSLYLSSVELVVLDLAGSGSEFAPTPQSGQRSAQDPGSFIGSLWFMESGSLQVRVKVMGPRGVGQLVVPVTASALQKVPMSKPLVATLFGLMFLLVAGGLSIVSVGAREAELSPGESPSATAQLRARRVMIVSGIVLAGILYLGNRWWKAEDAAASARLYRNPKVSAILQAPDVVLLKPDASEGASMSDLIPDHGHLMHLFLIRMPAMDVFAHLHPNQRPDANFSEPLPAMPEGHYRIFADIVHRSGVPATMIGEIDLPAISGQLSSGDDSVWQGSPESKGEKRSAISALPDGGRMVWESPGILRARLPVSFRFRVEDHQGHPVNDLQTYMGMAGHAEFVRTDLGAFAHVHPAGSVSMAALQMAQSGLDASLNLASSEAEIGPMEMTHQPEISFPYGFPSRGDYRIFVQIKRAGRIETGVFDAYVN
jgi:hypothetical protein